MSRHRMSPLLRAGLAFFAIGAGVRFLAHGRYTDFVAGALLGMSLVFLITGLVRQSRQN